MSPAFWNIKAPPRLGSLLNHADWKYSLVIEALRGCPWHAGNVAHSIWQEWWTEERFIEHVRTKVNASIGGSSFPFTLVAHDSSGFAGTISVVESNMEPRRDLSPWLSALWVESEHRGKGVGTALITGVINRAHQNGRSDLYLVAASKHLSFTRSEDGLPLQKRKATGMYFRTR